MNQEEIGKLSALNASHLNALTLRDDALTNLRNFSFKPDPSCFE